MQQITEKLYVGDMTDALMNSNETTIDVIIYLGQEIPRKLCFNCVPICIHMPLNDGENGIPKIKNIIQTAYSISSNNETVLIACRAGVSRSVLITASLFALTKQINFEDAYNYIVKVRPQSLPEQNLLREVKQAMEELKCCS